MEARSFGKPAAAGAADRVKRTIEALRGYEPGLIVHAASPPGSRDVAIQIGEERELLSALAVLGVRATIVGSAAVLAGSPPDADGRHSEEAAPRPVGDYGIFKLQQERIARDLGERGWRVCIARLFNPIGRGMKPHLMLGRLVHEIVQREEHREVPDCIEIGSLSSVRDFMHVDDAADALLAVSMLSDPPPLIHVASGEGRSVGEVARAAVAMATRSGLELRETISSPSASAAIDRVIGDPRMLHRLSGWTRVRSVEAGIEEALVAERATVRKAAPRQATPPAGGPGA